MISNQGGPFLSHQDLNDDLTVQVSDANSLLGSYLLEGDWEEALDYLDTHEGVLDATAKNDPLGLFLSDRKLAVPQNKNGALFASLYVRAPFSVIEKILNTGDDADVFDLMYVLSVIPHEEDQRLQETQRKIPYRSRSWTKDEYSGILNLFLNESQLCECRESELLLQKCPSWILPPAFSVTPLAMAAYNLDVPSSILQQLCNLDPRAIDKECHLFNVSTIPLIAAAASPIPPSSSPIYDRNDAINNRWRKVKLLLNKDWFHDQYRIQSSSNDTKDNDLPVPPEITLDQVKVACNEAMTRKEWELVRELMKEFNSMTGEGEDTTMSLIPIQTALARHDQKVGKKLRKKAEQRNRDEWLHRNMGLFMYPADALKDLVNAMIPKSHDHTLVQPMS